MARWRRRRRSDEHVCGGCFCAATAAGSYRIFFISFSLCFCFDVSVYVCLRAEFFFMCSVRKYTIKIHSLFLPHYKLYIYNKKQLCCFVFKWLMCLYMSCKLFSHYQKTNHTIIITTTIITSY